MLNMHCRKRDVTLALFDLCRSWIANVRANSNMEWDKIYYANKSNEQELRKFLDDFFIGLNVNVEEWYEIVLLEKKKEENRKAIEDASIKAIITESGQNNAIVIPTDPNSSWQLYRKKLLKNGFQENAVDAIESATLNILKQLSSDTTETSPVKGMVVGNVQSGKTANMAGLMAMAADWGWNMFIVLSGTIDNLRKQTQERLWDDLNSPGNLNWIRLEHLSKKSPAGSRLQDLNLTGSMRYFTVCLKNSTRLTNLINWLHADKNKQQQLKILVIEDEADQASINTKKIKDMTEEEIERTKINGLLCNLVNGKTVKGQEAAEKYRAMNYVGYTATPYANFLNEPPGEGLYPKSFITTLEVSKEYFGPQQIFGVSDGAYDGLDIVRLISQDSVEDVKEIHQGYSVNIPKEFEDALCWFLCGVSAMRVQKYKKPVSMLIHTSQMTSHHQNIADAVQGWFNNNSNEQIITKCKTVWENETARLTKKAFRGQYHDYGRSDETIPDYPGFDEIREELKKLLDTEHSSIKLDEEGDLTYHSGLHFCIDNCKNSGINSDGMHVRLAYPDKTNMPDIAPAFIVIGGATLSRGLTIEGLICTFFLRSVGQADTLMQMGRWFGYRKGYELMPRLWLTEKTTEQFSFLSDLDYELRHEIYDMAMMGKSPEMYAPRVKNTPKYSFIRITAKNRMQSAEESQMDYSGAYHQTYLFENNKDKLQHNLKITEKFVNKLGMPERQKECNKHASHAHIWRNIEFAEIKDFLAQFHYHERLQVFSQIKNFIDWVEQMTSENKLENWNIVLSGVKNNQKEILRWDNVEVHKVTRTQKINNSISDDIDIGALRDPRDLIADIDVEGMTAEQKEKVYNCPTKDVKMLRRNLGMAEVPQLIIYIIDKDSKYKGESNRRKDMEAKADLVGISINIPGGKTGVNYASTISIRIDNTLFDDNGDLGDINEN